MYDFDSGHSRRSNNPNPGIQLGRGERRYTRGDASRVETKTELNPLAYGNHTHQSLNLSLNIVKPLKKGLILIEVPPEYQQYGRALQTNLDYDVREKVKEVTRYGDKIDQYSLLGAAAEALQVSADPTHNARIANGFEQKRFIFVLYIEVSSSLRGSMGGRVEIYKGFTDASSVNVGTRSTSSLDYTMDPDMLFTVTDSQTLSRTSPIQTSRGGKFSYSQIANQSVLFGEDERDSMFLLRPEDAVAYSQNFNEHAGSSHSSSSVFDSRISCLGMTQLSSYDNNLPHRHLSELLGNMYMKSGGAQYLEFGTDEYYDRTLSLLYSGSINQSAFWTEMFRGSMGIYKSNSFTLREFNQTFRTSDKDWDITLIPPHEVIAAQADTHHWAGSDAETVVAYALKHQLPVIMADHGVTMLRAQCTNMTPGNKPHLAIHENGIMQLLPPSYQQIDVNVLKKDIITQVITPIMSKYCSTYDLTFDFQLDGTADIWVSLDGDIEVPLRAPMYSRSLDTPLRSNNDGSLRDLTQGTIEILGDLMQNDLRQTTESFATNRNGSESFDYHF